jgi:hypothetical protein
MLRQMLNRVLVTCMLYGCAMELIIPLIGIIWEAVFEVKLPIDAWANSSTSMLSAVLSIFMMYNSLEIIHDALFIVETLGHSEVVGSNILDFKSCINDIPDTTVDPHEIKTAVSKCLIKSAV